MTDVALNRSRDMKHFFFWYCANTVQSARFVISEIYNVHKQISNIKYLTGKGYLLLETKCMFN